MFELLDPEEGFTSDVIRDPERFVGRADLIQDLIKALGNKQGLIAIYGRRGVGKSSLLRQLQQMAAGDYSLATKAGLAHLIPRDPRKYYTVYYSCDSNINDRDGLIRRLCNDTDSEDGLLRLVPDKGKKLVEFSRGAEKSTGLDLRIANWGESETTSSRYSSAVESDIVQTFRNFVGSVVEHNNRIWRHRDSVLILLDEFDVIKDKRGLGSLMKSMSSDKVKFGVCGIGKDISALIEDHASVGRLIEQGAIHVNPMSADETKGIFTKAEQLFGGKVKFSKNVVDQISGMSEGYPYFSQLLGKRCIELRNELGEENVDDTIFSRVLDDIANGKAFPNLESQYQLAIGNNEGRAMILALLAEQNLGVSRYDATIEQVVLKSSRYTAQELQIEHIDQLIPRLVEDKYGPVLLKTSAEKRGVYEFIDPVFRSYVKLRRIGR